MNLELSFPPKFLDFPIHRLMDCNLPRKKGKNTSERYSEEGVALLRKEVVAKAFGILEQFDIDKFSSVGQLVRLQQKIILGLLRKNTTQIQEALTVIFNSIGEEIRKLNPNGAQNNFELISKGWDLEILSGSMKIIGKSLGNNDLWEKYGHIFREIYKKHGDPTNIKGRLRAIREELDGGGGKIYYRGQWREANWESQLSELRILEYMYLVENRLLHMDD